MGSPRHDDGMRQADEEADPTQGAAAMDALNRLLKGLARGLYSLATLFYILAGILQFAGATLITGITMAVLCASASHTTIPPGWAFRQARRGWQWLWILAPIIFIALIPMSMANVLPWFVGVYAVAWYFFTIGAVHSAWREGDPTGYSDYQFRKQIAAIFRAYS